MPRRNDAQAFWEDYASRRPVRKAEDVAGLALYGSCPVYDGYRDRAERLAVASLLPAISPEWRALDLGCGPGRWTVFLAQHCKEVAAVDFAPSMLEHARSVITAAGLERKVKFVQSSLEGLDAGAVGGPFDLVFAFGVLQFVAPPGLEDAARRLAACIRPGGFFLQRETRARVPFEKEYAPPEADSALTMKSYYKTFAQYKECFARQQLCLQQRRSIIPPSLLYSAYSRCFPPGSTEPWPSRLLQAIVGMHESCIDPVWRRVPGLLWAVNSRRPTDQMAALYHRQGR